MLNDNKYCQGGLINDLLMMPLYTSPVQAGRTIIAHRFNGGVESIKDPSPFLPLPVSLRLTGRGTGCGGVRFYPALKRWAIILEYK